MTISNETDAKAQSAGFTDASAHREFVRLCVASFLMALSTAHTAVASIAFQLSGFDLHDIGILLSSIAIPTLIFALLSGALIARVGALVVMRLAATCSLLALISLALMQGNFYTTLCSRLLWGVGVGLFLPAGMVYAQSRLNAVRGVYLLSLYSAMFPLAQAFAPVIGETMLKHFGVWPMFALAAVPAALSLVVSFGLRPLIRPVRSTGLALTKAFRSQSVMPIFALIVTGSIYGYSISYLAPSMQLRGLMLATFFVSSTAALIMGRFGGMRLLSGVDPRILVIAGLVLSGVGMGLIAWASAPIFAIVAGVIFGFGNSILYPVACAWITRGVEPSERGGPIALATTAFYFGLYAMPYPQTFLIAAFGYTWTEYALAISGLVGAVIVIARPDRR